ncbi:conserved hypothetical protein [Candidatus Terasakiella magnetica]|nr:conserved hypothetical protein [Candidatus Terasakiella magnetica]
MTVKRAICLAGGGPAVGLSLGALERIGQEPDIRFQVWSLACIGAWLGVVWNQAPPGKEAETARAFFKGIFRPDDVYENFPIAAAFAPDYESSISNTLNFVMDSDNYRNLVVPEAIKEASDEIVSFMSSPGKWSAANLNSLVLNQMLAVNPMSRFMTSLMYKSNTKGLSRIFYPDSAFLQQIDFKALYGKDRPILYHNAYNLTDQALELFSNKDDHYGNITAESVCACSALPYIEEPVTMGGKVYCEGATIDTVNFERLIANHPELEEVWVSRILDRKQIRQPRNLYDALNNLVMLFAATTSEDDVKLFRYHLMETRSKVKVVEIHVAHHINYDWSWSNLEHSTKAGWVAADAAIKEYRSNPPKPLVCKGAKS